jgi:hypothetical protein
MVALAVGAAAPAWADGPTERSAAPPARIANHYDYRSFQPSQAEVCAAQGASGPSGGLNCPSPAGAAAARDLSDIQRQIDATHAKYPPGYLEHADTAPR